MEAQQQPYQPGLSQAESRIFELQMDSSHSAQAGPSTAQDPNAAVPTTESLQHDHAIRQRRLGRACDACSKRKVKCGDVVPCRNCIQLGVECTFARPAKRRGPANRVAEDLKRARFEVNDLNSAPGGPPAVAGASPSAPALAPQAVMSYPGLDSLAPSATVTRMVYDFFTYVYPVFPFPHEHLVMERLRKREDVQNRSFCALVSALLATISSVVPRVAQNALNELEQNGNVITAEIFVGRCMLTCEQTRGPLTSGRDVDDAATAFYLGIVSHVRRQPALVDLYLSEALSIVKYLGVENDGRLADGMPADHVTKELCKRIYWSIYTLRRDIIPQRSVSRLPPLPLDADDYYIYIDRIESQPQGQLSTLNGFNLTTQLNQTNHKLLWFSLLDDEERTWDSTHAHVATLVDKSSQELDTILASGHPELTSNLNPRVFEQEEPASSPQARQHVRWELQKIMLRVALFSNRLVMAQFLATQNTHETKGKLRALTDKCIEDAKAFIESVTRASLEPVAKIIEASLVSALDDLRAVAGGAGQAEKADEFVKTCVELLRGL